MSPESLRVFVNGSPRDIPLGGAAIDAVRAFDADLAAAVLEGTRFIADSRGLPIASDCAAHGGAIYRVIMNRGATTADADED